tara:strand:- start:215 stop:421 length:207 start_codon:yes stop_codon:yes gene_type:complete
MDHSFIYFIHIIFGGPLLLYGGLSGKELSEKCNEDKYNNIFTMLIIVGIIVILYHGYKLLKYKGLINA